MPDPPLAYQVAVAVGAVVLAPAIEELLFRGVLLNCWAAKWSVGTAVVASSIAFGILHGNPVGITVAGLVMAVLYLRTGTLLVPIAFHAANNFIATIPEFMMGPPEPVDVAAADPGNPGRGPGPLGVWHGGGDAAGACVVPAAALALAGEHEFRILRIIGWRKPG